MPRSNPYVGRRGQNTSFASGLRNPWRFSFDRVTARRPRIVIADVGQQRFEEVNYETVRHARVGRARPTRLRVNNPISFGEDRRGRLYVITYAGRIFRVVFRR